MENLYTVADVAKILQVSDIFLWRMVREGKIKCLRIGKGRNIRFTHEHIDEYLSNCKKDIA